MAQQQYTAGVVAVVVASVLSSLAWVFEGEAIERLSALSVVTSSLLCGGLLLCVVGWVSRARTLAVVLRAITPEFILYSLVRSSILTLAFGFCLTLTSSSKTMFLTKVEPYIVLLIQMVWYGHRTTPFHLTLLAVHLGGAVLLSTGGVFELSSAILGDLLILLAVVGNALLYGPSQRFARQLGASYASGLSQLLGGLVLLPFALWFCQADLQLTPHHLTGWGYTVLTILVYYVGSTGLWFFALQQLPAWLASALRCVGPVVGAPLAWICFGHALGSLQVAGAFLVVTTSGMMVVHEQRHGGRRESAALAGSAPTAP